MDRVINHHNVELKIGDEIKIISDRISNKLLANVSEGDTIIITGFSEDGKILYHHSTLALPTFSDVYEKIQN